MAMTRYLVTSALPYANGPIHFGHIIGAYLPADVYVRYRRMRGDDVMFICGTDEHGVAITINAEAQGKDYGEFVKHWRNEIKTTFDAFNIKFGYGDIEQFSGTSSCPPHKDISQQFFKNLDANQYLNKKTEKQWYCETNQMFLADRYLEGTCPFCGAPNARGDECKKCGQWIDALNLKNPICKLCGNAPIVKETEHWYLDLPKLHEDGLGKWFEGNDNERKHVDWKPNVKSFVANMLKDLHDRPITRNLRWGVPLPKEYNAPEDKVLYVWFDAPIGYCSMTQELLEKRGAKDKNAWCEWWAGGEETKVLHFIGKDNIGFHTIVFPAMLFGQKTKFGKKMNLPWAVPAMEFYNLQGRKFSTSDGWTIDPKEFLQKFPNVDALRFTLLATAPETSDSEFSFEEYQKINNELANNIGNLLSRTAKFAREKLGGNISKPAIQSLDESTNAILCGTEGIIPKLALWNIGLESFQFRAACSAVLSFATKVNIYFDAQAPWKLIQLNEQATKDVIYWTCVLLEVISIIIEPFAPSKANEIRRVLGADSAGRERLRSTLLNAGAVNLSPDISEFSISEPPILFPKLDEKVITAEIESLKSKSKKLETTNKPMEPTPAPATPPPTTAPAAAVPTDPNAPKAEITYDDFMKCEFRIGTVIAAERVEKADKLLKLQVDIGREKRQVVAGIASKYTPEELVGKRVVVVCNLAPRKLRGAESQGMILAADDGSGPIVITPSADVKNGATVK